MGQIELENLSLDLQNKIATGGSGGVSLPIKASDISEEPSRVFVTSTEKAEIMASTNENASQTARIASIENTLSTLSTTDEKVKMTALDTARYLSELVDDVTIKNIDGKLTVEALRGLLSSVMELNFLQGASSNIQQQINNLQGVSSFRGVFASLQELLQAPTPQSGQYAIVSENGSSSYYFYYDSMWEFSHNTTGSVDIDINSGTIGILNKARYEKQNATETSFLDPTGKIIANNTQDAIVEVFRFADSLLKGLTQTVGSPLSQTDTIELSLQKFKQWWAGLANAITNKGVSTSTSNNGDEIIQKIGAIPNISVSGGIKRVDKLNATAPYNLDIILEQSLKLEDICVTLFEYVPGATGVVKYDVQFNNGDKMDFVDNEFVKFDGVASLNKQYTYTNTLVSDWTDTGYLQKANFNSLDFNTINEILV